MPRKLKPLIDFHQKRFMQISESHCGPAVIQMLLSNQGVEVTQEDVAEAGGATSLIELNGMRVDQLAQAVQFLAPDLIFYVKDHATIEELARVVIEYRHPAGVEWQGIFEDEDEVDDEEVDEDEDEDDEDEDEEEDYNDLPHPDPETNTEAGGEVVLEDSETQDDDYGHYSLVLRVDRRARQLVIADPYKAYFSQARILSYEVFDQRWYDFNEIPDPISGHSLLIKDDHLMFIVARRNVSFPRRMGFRTISP